MPMQNSQRRPSDRRHEFDQSLSQLAKLNAGAILPDVDKPMIRFNEIVADVCRRETMTEADVEVLYDALDYFLNAEGQRVQDEIVNAVSPFQRALFALAGHVIKERGRRS